MLGQGTTHAVTGCSRDVKSSLVHVILQVPQEVEPLSGLRLRHGIQATQDLGETVPASDPEDRPVEVPLELRHQDLTRPRQAFLD